MERLRDEQYENTPNLLRAGDLSMIPLPGRVSLPGVAEEDLRLKDSTKMLLALSRTHRHFYEGTVPAAVKARRRAKNRAARRARRVHRG